MKKEFKKPVISDSVKKVILEIEKLQKIQLLTRRLEMAQKGYSSEKFEDILLEMERVIFELNTPEGDK